MDGGVRRFFQSCFFIVAIVVLLPAQALAGSVRCKNLKKIETPEQGRVFYAYPECRDIALERVISLLSGVEKEKEVFEFLEQIDPLSVNARRVLLSFHLENSPEEALKQYNLILQLEPGFFSEYEDAKILISLGKTAQAIRILDKLILAHPGDLTARRLRAVAYYEAKSYDRASGDLQFFLSGSPESSAFQMAAAKTFFKLGKKERSLDLLRGVVLEELKDDSQLIAVGSLAEGLGDDRLAEKAYRALPSDTDKKFILMARALKRQGRWTDAQEVLAAGSAKFPSSDFLLAETIQDSIEQGRLAFAARSLDQWRETYPDKDWIKSYLFSLREKFANRKSGSEKNLTSKEPKRIPAGRGLKKRRPAKQETVRVRAGESLMSISFRLFGTHQRWKEILRVNRDKLDSPNSIQVGMKLRVPDLDEENFE